MLNFKQHDLKNSSILLYNIFIQLLSTPQCIRQLKLMMIHQLLYILYEKYLCHQVYHLEILL